MVYNLFLFAGRNLIWGQRYPSLWAGCVWSGTDPVSGIPSLCPGDIAFLICVFVLWMSGKTICRRSWKISLFILRKLLSLLESSYCNNSYIREWYAQCFSLLPRQSKDLAHHALFLFFYSCFLLRICDKITLASPKTCSFFILVICTPLSLKGGI